jgi:hypothetical protein
MKEGLFVKYVKLHCIYYDADKVLNKHSILVD